MNTTTVRLPEPLKARVAAAADRAGTTSHGFILEAIAEKTAQAEAQADFHATAAKRQAAVAKSGMTVGWAELRTYLLDKGAGKPAKAPKPRKLA